MTDTLIAWLREHCPDIRGDVAADEIESLRAKVKELEAFRNETLLALESVENELEAEQSKVKVLTDAQEAAFDLLAAKNINGAGIVIREALATVKGE